MIELHLGMEQPVVTSPTPAEKMIEGTNVALQCSAASSEVVSYQWFKGSKLLDFTFFVFHCEKMVEKSRK